VADPPYRSLYRRYRPKRFSDVRGQDHTTRALRNSVAEEKVAHAYLFSGPRGTGKTSTARILAMALNCERPEGGEPCGRCGPCLEVARGSSLDVHELDAASNNGVEAMRDLVSRAALGTPGRWKVYIVDEVHMLSTAASNALLKTLEEPPGHVVFVLATTDPQKVLPTIRSRTQHFEFRLLGPDLLASLLDDVAADASLALPPQAIDAAVRKGGGSARDALSALEQVVAAGAVEEDVAVLDELVDAVSERDAGRAITALAEASMSGRSPERLAAELVERLRQGFLAMMAPELVSLAGADRERVAGQARKLGLAALVRAMEVVGRAQVEMRDSVDPRLGLEIAVVRVTRPEADSSPAALAERLERLERRLDERDPLVREFESHSGPGAAPRRHPGPPGETLAGEQPNPPARQQRGDGPEARSGPAAEARATLGAIRARAGSPGTHPARGPRAGEAPQARPAPPASSAPPAAAAALPTPEAPPTSSSGPPAVSTEVVTPPSAAGGPAASLAGSGTARPPTYRSAGGPVEREDLVKAWGDVLLGSLKGRARALFRAGRFLGCGSGEVVFALPDETHLSYCEEHRGEVEAVLSAHFSTKLALRLVVDDGSVAAPPEIPEERPEELTDVAELSDPVPGVASIEERLLQMFPGAEEV
jgi:DNA polymerase-3 subunit gamma/tau